MVSGMGSHGVTSKQVESVNIDGTLKLYSSNKIHMPRKSTFRMPTGQPNIQEPSLWVKFAKKTDIKTESAIVPDPGL